MQGHVLGTETMPHVWHEIPSITCCYKLLHLPTRMAKPAHKFEIIPMGLISLIVHLRWKVEVFSCVYILAILIVAPQSLVP